MPLGNGLRTDAFVGFRIVEELQSSHDLITTPLSESGLKKRMLACRFEELGSIGYGIIMASND